MLIFNFDIGQHLMGAATVEKEVSVPTEQQERPSLTTSKNQLCLAKDHRPEGAEFSRLKQQQSQSMATYQPSM